ncbi:DMT family transporter [Clostridium hydrogeniformans]|uniref:DMT family transporter n=1 Tax=Clostridium hydrogeniformans TaxID=349933 RepID=UPI0004808D34|nr:DMT family transporter [Clostridium hydrogeniformans]
MYKLYSGIIGVLISIMMAFNGTLSKYTGNYLGSVIIHGVGLVGIILLLIITRSKLSIKKQAPLYLYSAGTIGVFTVVSNNMTFKTIGISLTIALGLLGQSFASIVIDHYGLLEMKTIKFKKKKILGLILISIGILIMTFY